MLAPAVGLDGEPDALPVTLNTHEPFVMVALGVQGGGKSHTLATVLESCLLPLAHGGAQVVQLAAPMSALVLHYDSSESSLCEATGLATPSPALARALGRAGEPPPAVPREKIVVLVSPSFYAQRKLFYGGGFTVRPLLFRWASLTADHIKRIMRISEKDSQLYVATMLNMLRQYQRAGVIPRWDVFIAQIREACSVKGQSGPLDQRIALLESLVRESAVNASIAGDAADLASATAPGTLVIVDLTDPLLSSGEANGVFQVLVEQYRALPIRGGKVCVLLPHGGGGGGAAAAASPAQRDAERAGHPHPPSTTPSSPHAALR